MDEYQKPARRVPISKELQVQVFRRDGWLCRWCGRPVIFAPVMKYLEQFVRQHGITRPLAYHDARWRRDKAPLLDHLGAVIDHVKAHSRGGTTDADNFVTSCNKCNMRKSSAQADAFAKRSPLHRVKGKYGEPCDWDGLATLFTVLVDRDPSTASSSELAWSRALKGI
jgi:5-methylcytosine-specific restriction endonuclease McrA